MSLTETRRTPPSTTTTIRVVIAGAAGRMGQTMRAGLAAAPDIQVVGAFGRGEDGRTIQALLDQADALVDFTTAEAAPDLLRRAVSQGVRPISGTTGLDEGVLDELDAALRARRLGGVWAPNFALGAALMVHFARIAARFMDAAEIVEMHHDGKADAPSGTALGTARAMREAHGADLADPAVQRWNLAGARGAVEGGVRIHSIRLPGLVGHQEVLFGATGQLLTIRHDAPSRDAYLPGVCLALRQCGELVGLTRGLDTLLHLT